MSLIFNVFRFDLRNHFPNACGDGFFATHYFCYKTYLGCIYTTYGVFKRLQYFNWEALRDRIDIRNTGESQFLDSYVEKGKMIPCVFSAFHCLF